MENKNVGIGCGVAVVAVVLLCGGVAFGVWSMVRYAGEQVGNVIKEQLDAEAERQDVAAQWRPPAEDAAPGSLFPEQLAGYQRTSHDDQATLPELLIERDGHHAVYESDGRRIDVYVYPVSSSEADSILSGVQQIYESDQNQSGFRRWSSIRTSDEFARAYLHTSNLQQNYLWFVQGWLVVFRTEQSEDIEPFVHAFFRESSADAAEGQEAP
ncbi:MAG: hypothetical protein KY475_21655 [Planctomycetes bacterium]|nr:hypothetical protein [Planctomycetota bacterium]